MNKPFKIGASLLVAAGTIGFVGATPANAAACAGGSLALNTLLPPSPFSCTQGGFTFTLTSYSGFVGTDSISFSTPNVNEFNFSVQKDAVWTSGDKILNYSVTAPSGKVFLGYTSTLSSSIFGNKTGDFGVVGSAGEALATLTNTTTVSGEKAYPGVGPAFDTFTATLDNISGGGIETVSSSYIVANAPVTGTPGPLPLLGAGAAFGFSRKLRSRVKLSA
jgi:hypothetical protein